MTFILPCDESLHQSRGATKTEVGVVEDDRGVFTAHLGLRRHTACGGRHGNRSPDTGRTGGGDPVQSGVVDEVLPAAVVRRHHIQDTVRKPCIVECTGQPHR